MNNDVLHGGSCWVWATGVASDCNCQPTPVWRIRKEPQQQFPWRVFRLTGDATYEPLMRCSRFDQALALVRGLADLQKTAEMGKEQAC